MTEDQSSVVYETIKLNYTATSYLVYTIVFAVFITFAIIGLALAMNRRNLEPLKQRQPKMMVMGTIFLISFVISSGIISIDKYQNLCRLKRMFPMNSILLSSLMFIYRAILLALKSRITKGAVEFLKNRNLNFDNISPISEEHHESRNLGQSSHDQIFKITGRKWLNPNNFYKIFLIFAISVVGIANLSLNLVFKNLETVDQCENLAHEIQITVFLCLVTQIIVYVVIYFKLPSIDDNFGIKVELRRIAYAFAYISNLLCIRFSFPYDIDQSIQEYLKFRAFSLFAYVLPSFFIIYQNIYVPIGNSYPDELIEEHRVKSNQTSFSDILDEFRRMILNPDGEAYISFELFLQKEFSIENLYFCKDVQTLKRNAAKSNTYMYHYEIYAVYILEDSPLSLNLSYNCRNRIKIQMFKDGSNRKVNHSEGEEKLVAHKYLDKLRSSMNFLKNSRDKSNPLLSEHKIEEDQKQQQPHEIPLNIFDEAVVEITRLMIQDSFRRYLLTRPRRISA